MQPPSEPQPKEKAHVVSEKVDIESSGGGQSPTLGSKDATSMDLEQDGVIDPVAEARLLRKLDWILLPMFTAICAYSVLRVQTHVFYLTSLVFGL